MLGRKSFCEAVKNSRAPQFVFFEEGPYSIQHGFPNRGTQGRSYILYEILNQLHSHCYINENVTDYAISLFFDAKKPWINEAEELELLSVLIDLPYKLYGHKLAWLSRSIIDDYVPELLSEFTEFPISVQEKSRRINSILLNLVLFRKFGASSPPNTSSPELTTDFLSPWGYLAIDKLLPPIPSSCLQWIDERHASEDDAVIRKPLITDEILDGLYQIYSVAKISFQCILTIANCLTSWQVPLLCQRVTGVISDANLLSMAHRVLLDFPTCVAEKEETAITYDLVYIGQHIRLIEIPDWYPDSQRIVQERHWSDGSLTQDNQNDAGSWNCIGYEYAECSVEQLAEGGEWKSVGYNFENRAVDLPTPVDIGKWRSTEYYCEDEIVPPT